MKLTCTKRYDDIPFAHRQPAHKGHCRVLHGHNFSFEFEFEASSLDACGFVVDFGGLKELKEWLNKSFDHALVLNETDPLTRDKNFLTGLNDNDCGGNIFLVPDCSAEGLAIYVGTFANQLVDQLTRGRTKLTRCTVFEDSRNSATWFTHEQD
jgi:6-pyruvoyltetrahydropterin/6-carboxytetrahydropterin synthase